MTNIGDMNRRLVLEAPTESDDGEGGVTRLYDIVTTLWGQVTPLAARADDTPPAVSARCCCFASSSAPATTSPHSIACWTARIFIASSPRA